MKRSCLECKREVVGRVDKKFCCDYCRNSYNNKLNGHSTNYVRRVNNALKKNRRILLKLLSSENKTITIHRERLVERGFNFSYYTNNYITREGKTYFFCYDYGYLLLKDEWYALVKRKEWD
jgi:hypothetical protein